MILVSWREIPAAEIQWRLRLGATGTSSNPRLRGTSNNDSSDNTENRFSKPRQERGTEAEEDLETVVGEKTIDEVEGDFATADLKKKVYGIWEKNEFYHRHRSIHQERPSIRCNTQKTRGYSTTLCHPTAYNRRQEKIHGTIREWQKGQRNQKKEQE